MSDINKYASIVLACYLWLALYRPVQAADPVPINGTNGSRAADRLTLEADTRENSTMLDFDFFSYDIVDHRTLLIKFDVTRTILFQHAQILYDAHLYVSKIPAINYKLALGPFSGLFEQELDGTIMDHFTLCLVLVPNLVQRKFNITQQRTRTESVYDAFLTASNQAQQQHILHYCTKMGPDEDRHRHRLKQGSQGDHVLLLLQLFMIILFLTVLQIEHTWRHRQSSGKRHEQANRIRRQFRSRDKNTKINMEVLELLRFKTIKEGESPAQTDDQGIGEDDDDASLMLFHQQLPSTSTNNRLSPSNYESIDSARMSNGNLSVEHILQSKPWLRLEY